MKANEMNEIKSNKMPKGIAYIVGNEAAERFSYYGMKCILTIFMTEYLMNSAGEVEPMDANTSQFWFHVFGMSVYAFPLIGALISDALWGKYKTIMILSVIYCLGHIALAMDETRLGLSLGLTMIAIGSGGIKPCVSAHVGDQFTSSNKHLMTKVFSIFYFAINLGSTVSTLLTPWVLKNYGPSLAFGIPGGLMILATIVFWFGRKVYISIPPKGNQVFKDLFGKEGLLTIGRLAIIYVFVGVFWSLFDQTGSSWVIQAKQMEVWDTGLSLFGNPVIIDESQLQAANPILVMLLIPFMAWFVYPLFSKKGEINPLKKIFVGLLIAGFSFVFIAWLQTRIDNGEVLSMAWQIWPYLILTLAEVLVSITALEFSYTQSPNSMKSIIMGVYLLSVSFGNFIAAAVNAVIRNEDGTTWLQGADYFMFFAYLMFGTGLLFLVVVKYYKGRTYIQDEGIKAVADSLGNES